MSTLVSKGILVAERLFVFTSFLASLLFCKSVTAQTQQVKFSLVAGNSGITLGQVNAMARDQNGFMWLSDEFNRAIIRYDGSHMTRFQNELKDSNSLGGAHPESLAIDSAGIIWVALYGQGLDKFNTLTNTFTHYRHNEKDSSSLSNDVVSNVLIDHLGNLWVGSDGGLDLMDKKKGTFKHFKNNPGDPTSLSHNLVRALYEDKQGEIWVGTGYPWNEDNQGGLNKFDRKTGKFTRYMHDSKNVNTLTDNKIRSIFEDSKGNFWIGTRGDGLHTLDRKTGMVTRYAISGDPEQPHRSPLVGRLDHITFITEDAEACLWIGTWNNGINRYNPKTKLTTHYGKDADGTGSFKDNSVWCAYPTADGLVWLASQEAHLYKVDLSNKGIPHYGNSFQAGIQSEFVEESESVLWGGTEDGLLRMDLKQGTSTRFKNDPRNKNSLSNNSVNSVVKDSRGNLWIGNNRGVDKFNPSTTIFKHYLINEQKQFELACSSILEDRDSMIWALSWRRGLFRINPKTEEITNYEYKFGDSTSITSNVLQCIVEGDSTDLWIGTLDNSGINRMNRKTGQFRPYLPGISIGCIYKDATGVIWAGAAEGLYFYNKKIDNFDLLADDKLQVYVLYVYSIVGDRENNLWISSRAGIYKLNQTRDHAILFAEENGVNAKDNFNRNSTYRASNGKIYFGDYSGYYSFFPDQLSINNPDVKLFFTNFWINDGMIKPSAKGPLKKPIFNTKEITLAYDEDIFSVSFTKLDFRSSPENKILYLLENYDKEWHLAEPEERVQYFKVPPGHYVMRLKAMGSSSGVWAEKNLNIVVLPPWWTTWWAYGAYALIFSVALFLVDRYQRRRLLTKAAAEAKEKELAQAREIEKAYIELKETQSQLIQSEKMASLGELTAGIAHEIQNPLNFVNNFSEVNAELIDEMQHELKAGNINDAISISNNIKENEQKINHHGKRADGIVKGMLQHSRSSSGVKEPTGINSLADEYLRLAYHGLRAKDKSFNATMKTDFDETIGNINIIPQDIGRVILNLITNAFYVVSEKQKAENGKPSYVKTSEAKYEPTVSVSTKKEGNKVLIAVRDNGNGIPQKILDKIFQPFFTTKPTGQGTGLGLSLSYDIVKAHGGEIKVNTKENEGTEFIVQIPIQ